MPVRIDTCIIVLIIAIAPLVIAAAMVLQRKTRPKFAPAALVNKSERRLFELLRAELPDDIWIFPQVSYGAILKNRSYKRYMSINAKRADFVVCNWELHPILVVEYQGAGHYGKTSKSRAAAKRRDRVKRQALVEAGLPLLEISAKFDRSSVREAVAPWAKAQIATL